MHAGMSYARIEALAGIQWPCYRDDALEPSFLHGRLWDQDPERRGRLAPFNVVVHELPVDEITEDFPLRLTTGRRLDSYNTGVQTGSFASPLRFGETLDLSPEDAARLAIVDGQSVRVVSRRGSLVAPARVDRALRPGLTFMTFHFSDEVDTNVLTIDAVCPRSGTAEFKATAVRVETGVDGACPRGRSDSRRMYCGRRGARSLAVVVGGWAPQRARSACLVRRRRSRRGP